MACGVQILGMYANIQFSTPICVKLDTRVATIWTEKWIRGGIFM